MMIAMESSVWAPPTANHQGCSSHSPDDYPSDDASRQPLGLARRSSSRSSADPCADLQLKTPQTGS